MSHTEDWEAKNVSTKPIMAIVATVSFHFSNGFVIKSSAEHEAFFHPQVVQPGISVLLAAPSVQSGTDVIDEQTLQPTEPACEFSALWVQFLDGTTFGDQKYAQHLLNTRGIILSSLAHLEYIYKKEGTDKFVEELQKPVLGNPFADGYIGHIRTVLKEQGATAAIQRLELHVKTAEARSSYSLVQSSP